MKREFSSYRDPDGYVTYDDDGVRRHVLNDNAPVLVPAYRGFFDRATEKGLLVPFAPVPGAKPDRGAVLSLQKLPLISYPYEWGFAQLRDAALVTLDIGLLALDHGLSLKDATAFNTQQYRGKMIFIDHTSFEQTDGRLPWRAYSQFCRHFMAPLLVTSRTGHNANKFFLMNLDGLDLGQAAALLPFASRFRPSVFVHIYLHQFLIDRLKDTKEDRQIKKTRHGSQKDYLLHLRDMVAAIPPPRYDTEWHDYYNNTNYGDSAFRDKENIIHDIVATHKYACAWDLGGNNGHFSRIMASHADIVLSMDIDFAAIDLNYAKNKQEKRENIFPLVMDLANPSPALGFGNAERGVIGARSKPDILFALALVHHLAITYNIPFAMVARRFAEYGADLVIEFVDREDSQFKKLLRSKADDYAWYNRAAFEAAFFSYFRLVRKYDIPGAHRALYHLRAKA